MTIQAVIYNTTTGSIDKYVVGDTDTVALQVSAGQAQLTVTEQVTGLTHYVDISGTPTLTSKGTQPTPFHIWNYTTSAWVETLPDPTYSSIVVVTNIRYLELSFTISDTNWPDYPYETEIWVSDTNDIDDAVLTATITGTQYTQVLADTKDRYIWLRPSWSGGTGDYSSMITVPASVINTADIAPNAVTQTSFAFSTTGPTGNVITTYTAVVSGTLTNDTDNPLPFYINLFCRQVYSAGEKNTAWLFRDITLDTTVHNWGVLPIRETLPAISFVYEIPANTSRQIALYWAAEDNTVSLSNLSFQLVGVKR